MDIYFSVVYTKAGNIHFCKLWLAALFRTEIIKDNTTITDVKDIANEFNYYFANIGINLAKSIPEITTRNLQSTYQILKHTVSTFFLPPLKKLRLRFLN